MLLNGFSIGVIIIGLILVFKSYNALRNHRIICDAIAIYRRNAIAKHDWINGDIVSFDINYYDTEDIFDTIFRLWDWSYKRILPADKFAIIEPYIKH
jgi:hypothetical protein